MRPELGRIPGKAVQLCNGVFEIIKISREFLAIIENYQVIQLRIRTRKTGSCKNHIIINQYLLPLQKSAYYYESPFQFEVKSRKANNF